MRTRTLAILLAFQLLVIGAITVKANSAFAATGCVNPTYLHALEDAEINSRDPFAHYTTSVYAEIGREDTYSRTYRYLIKPDVSTLGKNAKITSAILHLDQVSTTWDQDGLYELHAATATWSTNDITWSTQPSISKGYVSPAAGSYGDKQFDVTAWMKKSMWHKNAANGFLIKKPTESGDNSGLFATIEYGGSGGSETPPFFEVCLKK